MKKILIAPDKFKGTMSSALVADIIAEALNDCGYETVRVPMADGGEGTAESVARLRGMDSLSFEARNSFMTPIGGGVKVWFNPESREAAVDTSTVLSLQLLDRKPDIMSGTSFGFGQLLHDVNAALHPVKIYIGVGGTSTGDAGAGMLQALGCRIFDKNGYEMSAPITPRQLAGVGRVDMSLIENLPEIIVLSDVDVPLVAREGEPSSLSFAPQKGASADEMPELANNLRHWEKVSGITSRRWVGAGGGLGGALLSLHNSHGASGAEWMLHETGIFEQDSDLIITGEGCIDSQTAMGKIPGIIGTEGIRRNIAVIAIGGRIADDAPRNLFTAMFSTTDYGGTTPQQRLRSLMKDLSGKMSRL